MSAIVRRKNKEYRNMGGIQRPSERKQTITVSEGMIQKTTVIRERKQGGIFTQSRGVEMLSRSFTTGTLLSCTRAVARSGTRDAHAVDEFGPRLGLVSLDCVFSRECLAASLACRLADLAFPVVPEERSLFAGDAAVDDSLCLFFKVLVVYVSAPVCCAGECAGAGGEAWDGGGVVAREASGAWGISPYGGLGSRRRGSGLAGARAGGVWRRLDELQLGSARRV